MDDHYEILLSKYVIQRNRIFFAEYKSHANDSYCALYCFCMIYLTDVLEIDFESAVLSS